MRTFRNTLVASLTVLSSLLPAAMPSAMAAVIEEPIVFSAHDNPDYDTMAYNVNKAGTVVGFYYDSNYLAYGFLRHADGSYTDIIYPQAPTGTYARAINDAGMVVGTGLIDGWMQGWIYDPSTGGFQAIEVPGAKATQVSAIDKHNTVLGFATIFTGETTFYVTGFTWKKGKFKLFQVPNALYTYPNTLNSEGQIGGSYVDAGTYVEHTFVMDADGTVHVIDAKNRSQHAVNIFALNKHGDTVGTCADFRFTNWGCYYHAATAKVTQFKVPGLDSASPFGLDHGDITGFGYVSSTGKSQGFVIPKASVLSN